MIPYNIPKDTGPTYSTFECTVGWPTSLFEPSSKRT